MSVNPRVQSRIRTSVLKSEGEALRGPRDNQRSRAFWNPGTVEGIVTTAITAATVSSGIITYGQGAVQIVIDDPSNPNVSMNDPSYPSPVTVYSISTTTAGVATGKNVLISWRNGRWALGPVDCGN